MAEEKDSSYLPPIAPVGTGEGSEELHELRQAVNNNIELTNTNDTTTFPDIRDRSKEVRPRSGNGDYSRAMQLTGNRASHQETSVVVGTSASHSKKQEELPDSWTSQRLNEPNEKGEFHMTKLQWENQIAKHILSMFATTNAVKNIGESTTLLDFVEVSKPKQGDQMLRPKAKAVTKEGEMSITELDEGECGYTLDCEAPIRVNDHANKSVKTTKKKTKVKKKAKKAKENEGKPSEGSVSEALNSENYHYVERVMQRIREEQQSLASSNGTFAGLGGGGGGGGTGAADGQQKKKRQHRITNTIKLKGGGEMVIRGSPKCFPIWFVSTGDVYADWTVLPGDDKLQAHLNVLYEDKKYTEYLGILETLIVQLWRNRVFGEEEFTLGSFGKSMEPVASIMNSRVGTARSGRRSNTSSRGRARSRGGSNSNSPTREGGRRSRGGGGGRDRATSGKDDQFGPPLDWEDDGDGGLIPVVPAYSTSRDPGGDVEAGRRGTGTPAASGKGVTWGAGTRDSFSAGAGTGAGAGFSPANSPSQPRGGRMTTATLSGGGGDGYNDDDYGAMRGTPGTPHHRYRPSTRDRAATPLTPSGTRQRKDVVVIDHVPQEKSALSEADLVGLWKRLILTAIAMGVLCVERKQLEQGMTLFRRAEMWSKQDDMLVDKMDRKEMNAHVRDAISFYFYKKGRSVAAQGYAEQALELYEQVGNMDGVAACLLHVAAVYSALSDFKGAHKVSGLFVN